MDCPGDSVTKDAPLLVSERVTVAARFLQHARNGAARVEVCEKIGTGKLKHAPPLRSIAFGGACFSLRAVERSSLQSLMKETFHNERRKFRRSCFCVAVRALNAAITALASELQF